MPVLQVFDRPAAIPPAIAQGCVPLTKGIYSAEMLDYFNALANGNIGDTPPDLSLAVALLEDEADMTPIGWASLSLWNSMWQVQGFVHEPYRRRGLASALCSVLLLTHPDRDERIAVFSDHCRRIVTGIGFRNVEQWKAVDDGWIKVGEPDGQRNEWADSQ